MDELVIPVRIEKGIGYRIDRLPGVSLYIDIGYEIDDFFHVPIVKSDDSHYCYIIVTLKKEKK